MDRSDEDRAVAEGIEFLKQAAQGARKTFGASAIVANIAQTSTVLGSADLATPGTSARFVARMNSEIALGAENGDWMLWDIASLAARLGHENWFDPVRFHQAKTPFKIEITPLISDHLIRIVAAMTGKTARALILDLDNTVWGGVIGDDGLSGIRLGQNSAEGEAYVAFQRFVLQLRERGIVLAVCSKNTDEIAREPFRSHPEMLLKEDHVAVFQANWEDKASNILAIASELNLGLESLVFVDDNPAERERVRQELPLVAVPEVGTDPAYFPSIISNSGLFEHLLLNPDDLGRAESYRGNARRAELQAKAADYDEYLQSLQMNLEVSDFDSIGQSRIAQLINKSNQFNLTTRRYDEEEVRQLSANPNTLCWQARLDDFFAAHGMIAVVIVRTDRESWLIDTWLQSCRVLSRGVEETLMNLLVDRARESGVKQIIGEYIPTARNGIVADFFPRLGFEVLEQGGEPNSKMFICQTSRFQRLKSYINVTSSAEKKR